MQAAANPGRYNRMSYRRTGRSGVRLPEISLGLWQNFGESTPAETQREIIRTAFDHGIVHFDLANNYGPGNGAAEEGFGRILKGDLTGHRDELFIATKAGYRMWDGPFGDGGSRKHLLASLDQSLARMGLDYVDVFYSHRADPETPLEETVSALHAAVQSGRALYAGISSYSPERTRQAAKLLGELGTPLLVSQSSYSMFNRWVEGGLLDVLEGCGAGLVAFSPLAQGMLTARYVNGVPEGSRAARNGSLKRERLSSDVVDRIRKLNEVAQARGQSLAQLALKWVLRDPRVSTVLIGASSSPQLLESIKSVSQTPLTADELAELDHWAVDLDINIWSSSSSV